MKLRSVKTGDGPGYKGQAYVRTLLLLLLFAAGGLAFFSLPLDNMPRRAVSRPPATTVLRFPVPREIPKPGVSAPARTGSGRLSGSPSAPASTKEGMAADARKKPDNRPGKLRQSPLPSPGNQRARAGSPDADFLVVIPARDEAATIAEVIGDVHRTPGCPVVVVDDASRDNTRSLARAAGARVLPLHTLWWLVIAGSVLVFGALPQLTDAIGHRLGVHYPPILLVIIGFGFLLIRMLKGEIGERYPLSRYLRKLLFWGWELVVH